MFHTTHKRHSAGLAAAAVLVLAVSACSSSGSPGGASGETDTATEFTVLTPAENSIVRDELSTLSTQECAAQNTALPLKSDTVAQADVVQKITLLAGQDALPVHFVAGTAQVKPDGDLGKNNLLVDYEAELTKLGVWDNILPSAANTIKDVYGGMVSLPYQYNIEGIWYNKKIFADAGVEPPTTWDELVTAAQKLKGEGVVPITEPGAAGWPITRLIGNYIFRSVGPDAMTKIQDGSAKLTDPEYVAGAQAVADLGKAELFGKGITSRDVDTANTQFLNGDAAMFYNGSWFLSNLNDPEQNKIGEDAVGFMPFPEVTGGAGSSSQWPANAGTATALSTKSYGPKVADWMKCVATNYGSSVLKNQSVISGFKVNTPVSGTPALTTQVQEIVSEADQTVLWFEARMDAKTTSDAQTNVAQLLTGSMTAQQYMELLQSDLDAAK